ncbi:MAG TPA: ribonuclease T [Candidatus Competibacteraceae bacterium]|nr:MAG: ribonuclease T [Candidatus Competibacteraceae bacterium]HOB61812.1 ribonuclease T [Candidatus Competibacteraceae bacterium]HQA27027.1 ribonuclease T [Candidatus Competibacteraceae bacterium]HQD56399.1 ribonuclease T [Candidatus Competibacteraceae bacterium]
MNEPAPNSLIASRFRKFLPVIIDVETGGLNAQTDALLEIAAVIVRMDWQGYLHPAGTLAHHIQPFPGSRLDPASMAINQIDPDHPFRYAIPEREALEAIFREVRREMRETGCTRAILVGHNAFFDQAFLNAAVARTRIKRSPFHPFSSFDTVTLAGLAYGQTVLARALGAADIPWNEREAHSAIYDAERTAELFCQIVNRWKDLGGWLAEDD